jgi:tetratricopeptide (TPR) repeat protein
LSKTLNNWKQDMMKIMKIKYPVATEEQINGVLDRMIEQRLKDRDVVFYDDYNQTDAQLSLLKFTDWTQGKRKPILSGWGVTFKQHSDPTSVNLPALMLDFLLKERKKAKKEMFVAVNNASDLMKQVEEAIEELDVEIALANSKAEAYEKMGQYKEAKHWQEVAKAKDREQKILKLLANSYYGASGEKNSIFYNMNMGAAVTYTGVQIITTAVMAFESFLASNVLFNNAWEIEQMISRVVNEEYEYDVNDIIDDDKLITEAELLTYLAGRIRPDERKETDIQYLSKIVGNLSTEDRTKVYYKNNLYAFLENSAIEGLLDSIIGVEFLNVEKVPEDISEEMSTLWDVLRTFVVYNYAYEDRYDRAMRDKRKAVLVVDTDSNFVNLDPFYKWVTARYELEDTDSNKLSIINVMIYVLAKFVQMAFDRLTENMNISPEKQPIINMKNEFLYSRLMTTSNKKQYAGNLIAQEGNLLVPHKMDMKGMSIKKTTVNRSVRDFFTKLLKDDVLRSKEIDLSDILGSFRELEDMIRASLLSGKLDFAVPANLNEFSSYSFPYRMQQVRGAIAWNALFPDNTIQPPTKVNTLKLKGKSLLDLQPIFDTEFYDIIKETIFDAEEDLAKHGFTIISIPKDVEVLPEWLTPLIDVETIISDNVRNGIIILESLGVKTMEISSSSYYSNIIEF